MEAITNLLQSIVPEGFDAAAFIRAVLTLCIVILAVGTAGRLIFGRNSVLNRSVSSAIGILFIYAITVTIYSTGVDLTFLLSPLPFITLSGEHLKIFLFEGANASEICGQLVSTIILAFLANLADNWLPQGKKIINWFFFRCMSVLLAMMLHVIVTAIMQALLPNGIWEYAQTILLVLLVIMMAVSALKLLVGIVLTTVNPLIGILYTFFFANFIGKALSKSVLTTALIAGLVFLLNCLDATVIFIGTTALAAFVPFLLLLLIVWYIIGQKY